MKNVVFVAPFVGSTMMKALDAFMKLENVRLGIISQQPYQQLPSTITEKIQDHYQVQNCLDPHQLSIATQAFIKEWGHVDRLLGYLEHLQLPLAQVRSQLSIEGMKEEQALGFRDKNTMKERLAAENLPVARQSRITQYDDLKKFISTCGFPIVLKPLAGVGSKNTMRVQKEEDVEHALNILLPSKSNPIQAEEFIQGEEHTMETVRINGKTVWQSSTYYLPGPLTVIENPWIHYCVLLPKEILPVHAQKFSTQNSSALDALQMKTGLSHMEWFQQKNGRQLISEVGARPPGVNIMPMMGIAHGVNMWEKWAELMVFERWNIPERKYAVASVFLRAQGRGATINRIQGVKEVKQQLSSFLLAGSLPKIGQHRSSHYEGDGWLILKHENTQTLVQALRKVLTTIRIEA